MWYNASNVPRGSLYTIRPEGKPGPERVIHRNLIRPCPNYPKLTVGAPAVPVAPRPPLVGWAVVPSEGPEHRAKRGRPRLSTETFPTGQPRTAP